MHEGCADNPQKAFVIAFMFVLQSSFLFVCLFWTTSVSILSNSCFMLRSVYFLLCTCSRFEMAVTFSSPAPIPPRQLQHLVPISLWCYLEWRREGGEERMQGEDGQRNPFSAWSCDCKKRNCYATFTEPPRLRKGFYLFVPWDFRMQYKLFVFVFCFNWELKQQHKKAMWVWSRKTISLVWVWKMYVCAIQDGQWAGDDEQQKQSPFLCRISHLFTLRFDATKTKPSVHLRCWWAPVKDTWLFWHIKQLYHPSECVHWKSHPVHS